MAIRITGMNSGLDTESIITELVKAQQTKVDTIKKQQTRHQWKQDAWKNLNAKIKKFYDGALSNMRYEADYMKKTTKVSNSSAVSVITGAGAVNGVQNLKVNKLATSGYLTGAKLEGKNNGNTKLSALGITDSSTIKVTMGNGKEKEIAINGDMTLSGLVEEFQNAGLNANFDAKSQRLFISSKTSGAAGDFSLTFSDENARFRLGLNTAMTKEEVNDYLSKYAYTDADVNTKAQEKAKLYMDEIAVADTAIASFETSMKELTDKGYDPARTSDKIKEEMKAVDEDDSLTDEEKAERVRTLGEELAKAEEYEYLNGKLTSQRDTRDKLAEYVDEATGDPSQKLLDEVRDKYESELQYAQKVAQQYQDGKANVGTMIKGEDAEILLNGALFTSSNNVFEVNGLTITALDVTDGNGVTLTTMEDTDGIFDMIKSFIKDYNELINEMDKLYNAESAKDYEPLTDDEKEEMSETEIEKWEQKIKDSVLRRDNTLNTVSSAMKEIMMDGVSVNGKTMHLTDFGIETLGYFNAADNEKNAYHIDGDSDDDNTKNNVDKLRAAIANDPDTVVSFFTGLSKNLWNKINGLMAKTDFSSSFTVYEDVRMKEEYDDYTEKIKKQEAKVTALEDKWYAKFSAMETALAKLQSNQSAVTSLLGG